LAVIVFLVILSGHGLESGGGLDKAMAPTHTFLFSANHGDVFPN
jgi:hypothetical protein